MEKDKYYRRTRFSPEVIREATAVLDARLGDQKEIPGFQMSVTLPNETWDHDSEEEFFADYRRSTGVATYRWTRGRSKLLFKVNYGGSGETSVEVAGPDRTTIEAVFEVLEKNLAASRLPDPPPKPPATPTIFIGHGTSGQWRDLKDHLHEKHGFPVEAYEIGARAGHTIRDILEDMLKSSSLALMVMTGDDQAADGSMRARQNVVHEVGLFQGRLGWTKAIVLLEEGTEEFSNIHGIHQVRFSKGNIRETFGEVLATIRREFP